MQSISLNTPTKTPVEEANNAPKSIENEINNSEADKKSVLFSNTLKEAKESVEETKASEEDELSVSEESESLEVDLELVESDELFSEESEEIELPDDLILEEALSSEETEAAIEKEKKGLSAILAQIETAKKTNTKVNDASDDSSIDKMASGLKDSKGIQKDLVGEQITLNDENKEEKIGMKDLLSDQKIVGDSAILHNKQDNHFSTMSVSDRLLNQVNQTNNNSQTNNQSLLTPSSLLQEPIELQSKQASAVMGNRILMMLNQGKQEVSIRLDPAELGSMHIKLHLQQDQLQVAIHTQAGQSRDIIEQNMPRLREQLAQQGISLGEATVQQESKQQSDSQQQETNAIASHSSGFVDEELESEQIEWVDTKIPLPAQGIDFYA